MAEITIYQTAIDFMEIRLKINRDGRHQVTIYDCRPRGRIVYSAHFSHNEIAAIKRLMLELCSEFNEVEP